MTLTSNLYPGGGLTWSKITGNTTAVAGNGYAAIAVANLTLTLPATPSAGDEVWFVDAANKATTYTLTIARNGENIESVAQDLVANADGAGFGLVYVDSTVGWKIVTEITSGGGGLTWSTITSNTTAVAGNGYAAVAAANLTLTLPLTPSAGNEVWFVDAADKATTYTWKIARNGENIESVAQDLTVNADGSGFGLVYVSAAVGWKITTEIPTGLGGGAGIEQLQAWNFAQEK